MEFFPFGLRKMGRGEEMDIPQEDVKVNKHSNQNKMEKFLQGKKIIRPALPTPWQACPKSRYGLRMLKHLQVQKPQGERILLGWDST